MCCLCVKKLDGTFSLQDAQSCTMSGNAGKTSSRSTLSAQRDILEPVATPRHLNQGRHCFRRCVSCLGFFTQRGNAMGVGVGVDRFGRASVRIGDISASVGVDTSRSTSGDEYRSARPVASMLKDWLIRRCEFSRSSML